MTTTKQTTEAWYGVCDATEHEHYSVFRPFSDEGNAIVNVEDVTVEDSQ